MKKVMLVLLIFFSVQCRAMAAEYLVLDNGLTIIYKQNMSASMTAAAVFIEGGNYIEADTEAGSVNLLHALLPKGTALRSASQIALGIEMLGGSISSEVGNDYSAMSLVLPTRYFREGFEIFSDVLANPVFPEEEIKKEKDAVIAGIRANKDRIFSYTYEEFLKGLYASFPYHRPIPGTEESVEKINRLTLQNYHARLFAPNNLTLVFITSLSIKDIRKIVDEKLGGLLPFDKGSKKLYEVGEREKPLSIKKERNFTQAYLMMGCLAPGFDSPDYPAMKILNEIAGVGGNSKIFLNLREKEGLAYELGSFFPTRRHKSAFTVYMGLNEKNLGKARSRLTEEILKLAQNISSQEIRSAKAFLLGRFIMDHESSYRQAWYMGWYQVMGKNYTYDDSYPLDIAKVSSDDIKRVHSQYLTKNNWVCVEVIPVKK